jgi:hypothetical protein
MPAAPATPPDRLILPLLRGGPLPRADESTWRAAATRLINDGLAGLTLTILARDNRTDTLPAKTWAALEAERGRVKAEQARLFAGLAEIRLLLEAADTAFFVHKGGAIAPLLYERPEDRPMVDVDLVIRPRDWERACAVLIGAGYRFPEGSGAQFWRENYYNVPIRSPQDPPSHFDLHWSLAQEGRYVVDVEDLFSRLAPCLPDGSGLRRLANEDLLLSLFLHLAYHYFEARLLWLYDMKLLLQKLPLDWDLLLARADAWGLRTVTALNLIYLEKVFPGTVPEAVSRRTQPGAARLAMLKPLRSDDPQHLFANEDQRARQFLIGLLVIDRPAAAAGFALDKITRSITWAGRRPFHR